ncbi:MAG: gliding motility-associated C-terminal domain-containing protein [Saprospiraceae bacterium]
MRILTIKKIRTILTIVFALALGLTYAQPSYDECNSSFILTDLNNWCSSPDMFTNVAATASPVASPFCFPTVPESHDVWFTFIAQAVSLNLRVIGDTPINRGGSLLSPQIALYVGDCNGGLTELECISDAFNNNIVETFGGPLVVGQSYFIRVDARNENTGSFQLCINNFNEIPDPTQDCVTGVNLCDKSPFTIQSITGSGNDPNEGLNDCINGEISSSWYKWTCDQAGTLSFSLTPNDLSNDIDFALYELPNGIDDCTNKQVIRCMASGENVGEPFEEWEPCTGSTGLSLGSSDTEEIAGCQDGNDNFVAAINMVAGRSYALLVNNFSNTGSGFSIEFGGTGTFLGPVPKIGLEILTEAKCEEPITVIDSSFFDAGTIVNWSWSFGAGAMPATANVQGPHTIVYNSVGTKSIVLTVETEEGCVVTEILELEIGECCQPNSDLAIDLEDSGDPLCAGDNTGFISVTGSGGTPGYNFSVDGGETYQLISNFQNLFAGDYSVYVRDIKGCLDSLPERLVDPPELTVDAGIDETIELGYMTELNATAFPSIFTVDYLWSAPSTLTCPECPTTTAAPVNTTTYIVTVTNENGCTAQDDVVITLVKNRPIYIPNAFSPDFDGTNDYFTAFGDISALQIRTLRIFNRWGALVFEANNIPLNQEPLGWDGSFRGRTLPPNVFAYAIEVEFLDNVVILYKGDITLIK